MVLFKKAASGLVLSMLVLCSNVPVSNAEPFNQTTIEMDEQEKTAPLAPFLTAKEILQVADMHINGYLKDDWQTKGLILTPSQNQIPLYDLEDHVIAYIVPLLSSGQEVGYISIGALRNSYDAYDIFIDDSVVQSIRDRLYPPSITAFNDSSSKLVFVPPMTYIIQTGSREQTQYFQLEDDFGSVEDVTQAVTGQKDQLQRQAQQLQTEQNEQRMQRILNGASDTKSLMAAVAVTKEDYALTVEASQQRFVPIDTGSGNYSYGGDQGWWNPSNLTKNERGCGPVAAANLTTYLAKISNPSAYRNLYSGVATSKNDFLTHMNLMYSYINPGPFGETSVHDFTTAVEKYAKDKNVKLAGVADNSAFTLDNTASYIKAGLKINSPVATLNLSKFTDYPYEWHWMTITKYYRDVNDNRWIAVSTWGDRRSINYRTHFEAITRFKSLGGGFMYFK